jgi:hypothetical protein
MIPKRIEALGLYARSQLYHDLSGGPHPHSEELLDRKDLDRAVEVLVKP